MNKKEEFKEFVKQKPSLVKYVNDGKMTWQKFYEMYDLYGESNDVWNEYTKEKTVMGAATTLGALDIINFIKNIDLDKMQESINSVTRVIGVLEDLSDKNKTTQTHEYKPRPLYKHFED